MKNYTSTRKKFARKALAKSIMLSAVLVLGACDSASNSEANISNHIKRGDSYMGQGQYKAALIETKNAIQKAPKNAEAVTLMAKILNSLGQSKSALNILNELESNDPEFLFTKADTLLNLRKAKSALSLIEQHQASLATADPTRLKLLTANAHLGLLQLEQAQALYEELISEQSDNIDAKLGLTKLALQNNNTDQAKQLLAEIFTLDPNHFEALSVQARMQHFQGDLAAAEDSLSNALAVLPNTDIMTPQRIHTLRSLAEVLTQQGRSAEALLYSKILAEAQPGMDELQQDYEQAITLLKEGKVDQAEELLDKVLAKAPYHEAAAQLLGIINYSQGDIESANQHFSGNIDPETAPEQAKTIFAMTNLKLNKPDAVLKLLGDGIESSNNPQTLSLYGMAAIAAGKYTEGEQVLNKVLSLTPSASRIRLALAKHYNVNAPQRPELALQELEKAYKQSPQDPFVQSALVQQYLSLQQRDKASSLAQEIARNNPESESSQIIAGNLNLVNQQAEQAKQRFSKAVAINPASVNGLQGLGRANLALKQYQAAQANFETLIEKSPKHPIGYKGLISVYELQGQVEKGLAAVDAMVTKSDNATPAAILAEYYGRTDNFPEANRYINSAKSLEPDNGEVRKLAATLAMAEAAKNLQQQNTKDARNIAMRGLTDSPNDQRLLSLLTSIEIQAKNYREASKLIKQVEVDNAQLATLLKANLAEAQGDTQTAIQQYRLAWDTSPNDLIAGKLYQQLQLTADDAASQSFLSEWLSTFPQSLAALTTSSNVEINAGRYNSAIRDLEKALSRQTNKSPALLNNLAWAYLQAGNLEQAQAKGKAAFDAAQDNAAIIDTYGWILVKSQRIDEGIAMLEKALGIAPNNTEIQQHLAEAKALR
ncbi:tetratricopeptide repeat protein [Dasania sp. GY-MA-18]|uniref:Tetratricopeptide repeat protein n=1 Tax=Dasania phycosphaerae TaxID=2950436 RepID=A0A9J6RQ51_9GAMM|nr:MULTISPECIES: tetratricopeptide repeat protein [Dasania]MCR8924126.1 tetratricopeptide repeat protein [Dasania sp. GY-MA-18]MCZ0866699.1 tetratricopeptide repeat protein [Dasania phycosphaerae]MCZ0870284.1 tetratricopeptide repeat protein [Dasania phycosphaerae]